MYTDGVTEEVRRSRATSTRNRRLEAYLTAHASQPVDELVRGLHAEVERFEALGGAPNDMTVLALRRRVG